MIFLGIDCSAVSASVAIVEFTDGEVPAEKILSSSYTNVGLTHSQTLVPMIKATLENGQAAVFRRNRLQWQRLDCTHGHLRRDPLQDRA